MVMRSTNGDADPPVGGGGEGEGEEAGCPELLLFALGTEWYGLPVEQVVGIEPRRPVARLPGVPPTVLGLLLWHGEVLPALDPAPLLTGQPGPAEDGYLVIGRAAAGPVALLVHEVAEVATVDPEAIEAPLPTVDPRRARLVVGQVQVAARWVAVLALEPLVEALVQDGHAGA
jgi:purine-binding chemotaxis protein CheW